MSTYDLAKEKAAALLALKMTRSEAAYAVPSDEEFALLLEENAGTKTAVLGDTRRAQILDSIANDAETFNRWMALVEAAETLGIEAFAAETQSSQQASSAPTDSVVVKISDFMQRQWKAVTTAGGGLAAAAAVFMMVASPNYQSSVDGLYDGHNQWGEKPAKLTVTRSLSTQPKRQWDATDVALYQGLDSGLNRLGDEFAIVGLEQRAKAQDASSLSSSALSSKEQKALAAIGQIAAMSYFKCSLGADEAYFSDAETILASATNALPSGSTTDSPAVALITSSIDDAANAEDKVCGLSTSLVKHLQQ